MSDEFDIVYNFLTENHYPEGFSKDEKRNFRRKVNLCSYVWVVSVRMQKYDISIR